MKKLLSFLLIFAFLLSMLAACNSHEHEFVVSESESKAAKCTVEGVEVSICSCGERLEKAIPALGHQNEILKQSAPSCINTGSIAYKCTRCNEMSSEKIDSLGHNFEESSSEPSRAKRCLNEGCKLCSWDEPNNKNKEALTFKFTKDDEATIEAKYQEVLAMVEAAAKYDPALHGYAETGALADEYAIVDKAHTELYELVLYAMSQQQLAMVAYYCKMSDKALEETYSYMKDYQTALIAQFYTLSRPFYDSCYRDYYYYGMTEEEILAFLFDSDTVSNPEYTALKDRNNAIEVEFLALPNSTVGNALPELYAEFAENNNKMAQMMGYENYLEYAYGNVYGRDYTYQDIDQLAEYVKTYITPVFNKIYGAWNSISGYTEADLAIYYSQASDSFFENIDGVDLVNDYIDLMAFDSNPDKMISFSDEFNKLVSDGNLFRGTYQGAFVTSIYSENMPIAYFGKGYDNCFTIIHEFGHYMNEVYSAEIYEMSDYSQSYDLLEMHSQGNELLYLAYLEDHANYPEVAGKMIRIYSLVNMFYSIMAGMSIDALEQAVYLNTYDGTYSEEIMADGTITWDEYDKLYEGILTDFGVADVLDGYWRYGMTITSPCYYVSYSVSALSVLQLYEMENRSGFDAAKDAYLKLFTYVDEKPEMTMSEILAYAGMLSFMDEQLYINLQKYFAVV